MLQHFARLDRAALGSSLLVTLTYPGIFPTDASTFRRHFHSFSKRLRRTFPTSCATWKLEYQTRGAPHFHLIVTGVPFIAKAWLSRCWYQVVGSQDERHLRAGTQVQRCRSARKALSYAAKYVAKLSTSAPLEHQGRFWGVVGRRNMPVCIDRWPLDRRGVARLSRAIRHLVGSRSRHRKTARVQSIRWCFAAGDRAEVLAKWASGVQWSPLR